jgi:hypothetical protein
MRKYKMVPAEPTPEMIEAAEEAHMPFGDMDLALRMAILAAPAVQGEPVDWKDGYRAAMNEAGWAVRELYVNHVHHTGVDGLLKRCQELEQSFICSAEAAPQPAPGVTQPVRYEDYEALQAECEKLRSLIHDIKEWDCDVDGGFLSIPLDLRRRMQEAIDAAMRAQLCG